MKRIVFVDDEPNVLSGLRRMLRPYRAEWEMAFLPGGEAALEHLAGTPCDVLVTDMRMPGMDGAALLQVVAERHPETVRMVLSGHSDQAQILRSVGLIHQFLAKPCEAETLRGVLDRTFALQRLLFQDDLRHAASRTLALPALPGLYLNLVEALRDERADAARVGGIIGQDMAMTAKLLQLASSSFFGLQRQIASPAEAVAVLGLETIRSLVLGVQIFSGEQLIPPASFSLTRQSEHGLATGSLARTIARAEGASPQQSEEAFLAGMLHDVGKLVLAVNLPEAYGTVMARLAGGEADVLAAERDAFGSTHAEVGAYLLGIWGLPTTVVEAVAFHHEPAASLVAGFEPLVAVHVANVLVNDLHGTLGRRSTEQVDTTWLDRLDLADRLPVWREHCRVCLA